ncbi:transposase, partial [Shewanella sp.]|uniref:transposase n=1 Tax=Shewanella sp. TaxID=50422 RepID=UPI00257DA465
MSTLSFWLSSAAVLWLSCLLAVNAWHCTKHHGGRGRGFQFSDTAIETALMLKGIFKLSLRATEGFIN